MIWWWVGTLLLPAESYRYFAYGPQLVSLLSPVKKGVKADICILQICSTQASSWLHYLVNNKEHWGLNGCGNKAQCSVSVRARIKWIISKQGESCSVPHSHLPGCQGSAPETTFLGFLRKPSHWMTYWDYHGIQEEEALGPWGGMWQLPAPGPQ